MRLFQESFDAHTPAQLQTLGKWGSVGAGVVLTAGRTGQGVTGTGGAVSAANTLRSKALGPATVQGGYFGIAVKFLTLPAAEQKLWAVLADSGTPVLTGTITTDGKQRIYAGTMSGTLLNTSTTAFVESSFRYLEVGWTLSGTGRVESRSIPATGTARVMVGTGGTAAGWGRLEFYLTDQVVIDDHYVNDADTFHAPAYFNGDTVIEIVRPVTEAPSYGGLGGFPWTKNTGPGKAEAIADATTDGDATYVYTRAGYSYILFDMEQLTDDGRRVDAVQAVWVGRNVGGDWAPETKNYVRFWYGVNVFIGAVFLSATSYRAYVSVILRPGGNEWTIPRVNASQFGMAD